MASDFTGTSQHVDTMNPEVMNADMMNADVMNRKSLDKELLDKNPLDKKLDKTDTKVDKKPDIRTLQAEQPDIHPPFHDNKHQDSDIQQDKLDISLDKNDKQTSGANPIAHYPDRMVFTSDRGRRFEFFAPNAYDLLGVNYADLFGGETQAMITFLTKLCPEFTQKTARHLSFKDIIQLIAGANTFLGKQLGPSST